MSPELRARLETLAAEAEDHPYFTDDDYNPGDYAGGNFDDCLEMGLDLGEINLARQLLREFPA